MLENKVQKDCDRRKPHSEYKPEAEAEKMAPGGPLGGMQSRRTAAGAHGAALRPAGAELPAPTGHRRSFAGHGHGHRGGTHRPAFSPQPAGGRRAGGTARRHGFGHAARHPAQPSHPERAHPGSTPAAGQGGGRPHQPRRRPAEHGRPGGRNAHQRHPGTVLPAEPGHRPAP